MRDDEILSGSLLEESWLPLEKVAGACRVEADWLLQHFNEGLLPHMECVGGIWRIAGVTIARARRMRQVERDFDAVPELAALVADLLEVGPGLAVTGRIRRPEDRLKVAQSARRVLEVRLKAVRRRRVRAR